jgi:hypothetical protein
VGRWLHALLARALLLLQPIPLEPQAVEGGIPKVWASRCWGCPRGLHLFAYPYTDGAWFGACRAPGGPRVSGMLEMAVATAAARAGEDATEARFSLLERPAWCRVAGAREQAVQLGLPSGARW